MQSEERFLRANDLVRVDSATSVPADTKKKPRSKILSGRGSSRKYQAEVSEKNAQMPRCRAWHRQPKRPRLSG
jgi:hypothetical protein